MVKSWFVYALIDTRKRKKGRVFYIGKGSGRRDKVHLRLAARGVSHNPKLQNKIKKIIDAGLEYNVEILFSSTDEQLCFEKEKYWISFYGLETLCNLTEGGEGPSGNKWSDAQRAAKSLNHPAKIPITVDGISDSISLTCQRVGINHGVFYKWHKLGYGAQEIVNEWRLRTPGTRSIFRDHTKGVIKSSLLSGKKTSRLVTVDGVSDSIRGTSVRIGVDARTFRSCLNKGMSAQDIADHYRPLRSGALIRRGPTSKNFSGFKGITFDKKSGTWMAQIIVSGKRIFLGRSPEMLEAAKAYNIAALKYLGPDAYQNPIH